MHLPTADSGFDLMQSEIQCCFSKDNWWQQYVYKHGNFIIKPPRGCAPASRSTSTASRGSSYTGKLQRERRWVCVYVDLDDSAALCASTRDDPLQTFGKKTRCHVFLPSDLALLAGAHYWGGWMAVQWVAGKIRHDPQISGADMKAPRHQERRKRGEEAELSTASNGEHTGLHNLRLMRKQALINLTRFSTVGFALTECFLLLLIIK